MINVSIWKSALNILEPWIYIMIYQIIPGDTSIMQSPLVSDPPEKEKACARSRESGALRYSRKRRKTVAAEAETSGKTLWIKTYGTSGRITIWYSNMAILLENLLYMEN